MPGVTTGAIAAHLKLLGVFTSVGVGAVLPARHLVLDAEWGYKDRSNKVMPGPGRTSERDYMPTEVAEHGDLNENLYRVLSVQNYRPGTSRLEL